MYLAHFGLRHAPLGKEATELWDDGALTLLKERFKWLLDSPGLGLLTGAPGVGKTAALRSLLQGINPHRFQVIYLSETDFGRLDLYRSFAIALGLDPPNRRARLWRELKARIADLADNKHILPVWIIDEDVAGPEPLFRSDFRLSRPSRRPDKSPVGYPGRAMSFLQAAARGEIRLAKGRERDGVFERGATVDAARGH